MENQKFDINKLHVASPCSVGWENMSGDERVRHCDSCKLNVYNIAEMTDGEVEKLFASREGRLCIRLYRRADGTVLTKDCPVGLRAYQKKVARFAGAALATILGLFSVSFGQNDKDSNIPKNAKIVRIKSQDQNIFLRGAIVDSQGAVIPGVTVEISKKDDKTSKKIVGDGDGNYEFGSLSEGIYDFEINAPGFKDFKIKKLQIKAGETIKLDITLKNGEVEVIVGAVGEMKPSVVTSSSSIKTTITQRQIERLPF